MSFLDSLLAAIAYGADVTHLGVIGYGVVNVVPSSAPRSMAPSSDV
jgi:hypothetical protein